MSMVQSQSVALALVVLGTSGLSPTSREVAARMLIERVGAWALPYFRRHFAQRLGALAYDEQIEVLEHALPDVVLTAIRGAFHGGDEKSAHAWCKRVMRFRLLTEFRRRTSVPSDGGEAVEIDSIPTKPSHVDCEFETTIERLTCLIERQIAYTHREQDIPGTLRNFRSFFDARLKSLTVAHPASIEDHILHDDPSLSNARERNLTYQRRRRGRIAAQRALDDLCLSGEHRDLLRPAAQLFGLELGGIQA